MAVAETVAPVEDDELVDRLRRGDRRAFDQLYERYFARIYSFVDRRLRNRADSEETVQEVFINVFSSIHTYRGEAPFSAWIFGLTRRTIAGRFKRKRHPTVPLIEEDESMGTSLRTALRGEATPLENYEYSERIALLQSLVLNRLSPEQRTLFRMHHLEDRSIGEIARTLDKTENAVKSNLYRTRKILLASSSTLA